MNPVPFRIRRLPDDGQVLVQSPALLARKTRHCPSRGEIPTSYDPVTILVALGSGPGTEPESPFYYKFMVVKDIKNNGGATVVVDSHGTSYSLPKVPMIRGEDAATDRLLSQAVYEYNLMADRRPAFDGTIFHLTFELIPKVESE
ncbi:MAG: hypothetical protein ACYCOU_13590 [Sulfobacillus sp.]